MSTLTVPPMPVQGVESDPLWDHPIPPIKDVLGKHWQQPARSSIEVDGTHALMSSLAFRRLAEYSTSLPTGVYEGKMWKFFRNDLNRWFLRWYGPAKDPALCSIHDREILLVD